MRTRQIIHTQITKIAARTFFLAFCLLFGAMACAETVTLTFQPPEITSEPICVPKPADELIEAKWKAWKGDVLPDQAPEQIRGEMRRLMELDAVKWFSTIEKVYALMPSVDSQFGPDKAKLERVALLIAAGKIKDLTNQRLIEELMASKQIGRASCRERV